MKPNPAKPLWRHPCVQDLQARLDALPGGMDNAYEANEWTFQDGWQKRGKQSNLHSQKSFGHLSRVVPGARKYFG